MKWILHSLHDSDDSLWLSVCLSWGSGFCSMMMSHSCTSTVKSLFLKCELKEIPYKFNVDRVFLISDTYCHCQTIICCFTQMWRTGNLSTVYSATRLMAAGLGSKWMPKSRVSQQIFNVTRWSMLLISPFMDLMLGMIFQWEGDWNCAQQNWITSCIQPNRHGSFWGNKYRKKHLLRILMVTVIAVSQKTKLA